MTRDNGICSLLGLAKRAGKLAAGDEPVRELLRDGVIRAVFLSSDAGAAAARQAAFAASRAKVPLLTLPVTTEELGGALGRRTCALCALSDSGFAAKAAEKLAAIDLAVRPAAEELAASHARFQSRRGVKKHRAAEPAKETQPPRKGRNTRRPAAAKRKPEGDAPFRKGGRSGRNNNQPLADKHGRGRSGSRR